MGHPVEFMLIDGDFQERKKQASKRHRCCAALWDGWSMEAIEEEGRLQVARWCRRAISSTFLPPIPDPSTDRSQFPPPSNSATTHGEPKDHWLIFVFQGQSNSALSSNKSLKLLDFVWAENLKNSALRCLDGALLIALSKQISLGCAGIDREAVPRQTRVLRGMMDEVFQAAGGCSARQRLRLPLPATLHKQFSPKRFFRC